MGWKVARAQEGWALHWGSLANLATIVIQISFLDQGDGSGNDMRYWISGNNFF